MQAAEVMDCDPITGVGELDGEVADAQAEGQDRQVGKASVIKEDTGDEATDDEMNSCRSSDEDDDQLPEDLLASRRKHAESVTSGEGGGGESTEKGTKAPVEDIKAPVEGDGDCKESVPKPAEEKAARVGAKRGRKPARKPVPPPSEETDEYNTKVATLLKERKMTFTPWELKDITRFLDMLAAMDSNNFHKKVGMGEREARIFSKIVENRYYCFGHGIGRSGDIAAIQPKAAGASVLNRLLNDLILDWLRSTGAASYTISVVIPLSRSMALMLSIIHLRNVVQFVANAIITVEDRFVQIAMSNAGIEGILCPVDKLEEMMNTIEGGTACLISTTNDVDSWKHIVKVGLLCRKYSIPHIIDNAAGLYNRNIVRDIQEVIYEMGRVDIILSSTDASFLVPAGGTVLAGPNRYLVCKICSSYPGRYPVLPPILERANGRASMDPAMHVFKSLMRSGATGYDRMVDSLVDNIEYARREVDRIFSSASGAIVQLSRNYNIAIKNVFNEKEVDALIKSDKRIFRYKDVCIPLIKLPLGVLRSEVQHTISRVRSAYQVKISEGESSE